MTIVLYILAARLDKPQDDEKLLFLLFSSQILMTQGNFLLGGFFKNTVNCNKSQSIKLHVLKPTMDGRAFTVLVLVLL